MNAKSWLHSLTVVFNTAVLPILGTTAVTDAGQAWVAAHPAVSAVIGMVGAIANILLRFKTNGPIQ